MNTEGSGYIAVYLWLLTVMLVWLMVYQYASARRVELLSFRNFFLVGFGLFQLHGVARVLWSSNFGIFAIYDPYRAGVELAWLATVFLAVFLVSYQRGWIVRKLARRIPSVRRSASPRTLLTIAALLTVLGPALKFIGTQGLGQLGKHTGTGMISVAAATVSWVLITSRLKPAQAAFGGGLILANLFASVWRTFGRRPLVGVLAALMWTAYYGRWRHDRVGRFFPQLLALGLVSLMVLAFYTTIRREFARAPDPFAVLKKGDTSAGLAALSSGQLSGAAGLWVIENYPERFESRPLMTLRYMVMLPIPRRIWREKPEPLSTMIVTQAEIPQRSSNNTIPPGVIGYAAAEGGLYAVVAYALFLGLLLRLFDEYLRTRAPTPFVIAPTAAALGQAIGIPRGDVSLFTATMIFTTVAASVLMVALAKVVGRQPVRARRRRGMGRPIPAVLPGPLHRQAHPEEPRRP